MMTTWCGGLGEAARVLVEVVGVAEGEWVVMVAVGHGDGAVVVEGEHDGAV
jgi:hypothetical protein